MNNKPLLTAVAFVAFAFVAGVHPLVGLYAAFIVGLPILLIGASFAGSIGIQ